MRKLLNIIVHHSATDYTIEQLAKQQKHTKNKYHYLIGFDVNMKPTIINSHPVQSVGGHAFNWNMYSIGVCVSGNYELVRLDEKLYNELVYTCATLLKRYFYKSISTFNSYKSEDLLFYKSKLSHIIRTHSDCGINSTPRYATACPGSHIRKIWGNLLTDVALSLVHFNNLDLK